MHTNFRSAKTKTKKLLVRCVLSSFPLSVYLFCVLIFCYALNSTYAYQLRIAINFSLFTLVLCSCVCLCVCICMFWLFFRRLRNMICSYVYYKLVSFLTMLSGSLMWIVISCAWISNKINSQNATTEENRSTEYLSPVKTNG